jgi:hypothetical protein
MSKNICFINLKHLIFWWNGGSTWQVRAFGVPSWAGFESYVSLRSISAMGPPATKAPTIHSGSPLKVPIFSHFCQVLKNTQWIDVGAKHSLLIKEKKERHKPEWIHFSSTGRHMIELGARLLPAHQSWALLNGSRILPCCSLPSARSDL